MHGRFPCALGDGGDGEVSGAFLASDSTGAPCHECGRKIRTGQRVFYVGPRLDDDGRTCADCAAIDLDLFGATA